MKTRMMIVHTGRRTIVPVPFEDGDCHPMDWILNGRRCCPEQPPKIKAVRKEGKEGYKPQNTDGYPTPTLHTTKEGKRSQNEYGRKN